jgi:hypothetical protein
VKRFPTPTSNDVTSKGYTRDSGDKSKPRLSLLGCLRLRTPQASDADKWNLKTPEERLAKGQSVRLPNQLQAGGQQSPMWTEWFMGWPIGWSGCEPLATDKFQQWLDSHGISSSEESAK